MKQTRVLKIVLNEWKNENRDKRELSVIEELGGETIIMAKGDKTGVVEYVEGFKVHRFTTSPFGNKVPKRISRYFSLFIWAYYARRFKADIISGHDYIALLIGYLSTLFMRKDQKPKLVYDSHEFELGRNTKKRGLVKTFLITYLERFLISRSVFSIMVNIYNFDTILFCLIKHIISCRK